MILNVFSIFDSKVEAYMAPFFAPTRGAAIRMFEDAIVNQDGIFSKHSADFTLFHIGHFNDETGHIADFTPISLGNALEIVSHLEGK